MADCSGGQVQVARPLGAGCGPGVDASSSVLHPMDQRPRRSHLPVTTAPTWVQLWLPGEGSSQTSIHTLGALLQAGSLRRTGGRLWSRAGLGLSPPGGP